MCHDFGGLFLGFMDETKRKVVQIAAYHDCCYALCDDGTLWVSSSGNDWVWHETALPPGCAAPLARAQSNAPFARVYPNAYINATCSPEEDPRQQFDLHEGARP